MLINTASGGSEGQRLLDLIDSKYEYIPAASLAKLDGTESEKKKTEDARPSDIGCLEERARHTFNASCASCLRWGRWYCQLVPGQAGQIPADA
jgi:hypothetical protein